MSGVDVRGALRSLVRSPGFSLPTLLILALGIGATATIFAVLNGVVLSPLPFPEGERLVVLCERSPTFQQYCVGSVPTVQDVHDRAASLEAAGAYRGWRWSLTEDGESTGVAGGIASPAVFPLLGARPTLGRFFAEGEIGPDADDVVVLAHAFWTQRYGGDSTVIGRIVRLDGEPVSIVGVLPAGFEVPDAEWVELWRPLHVDPRDEQAREWRGFTAVGRLAENVRLPAARTELAALYRSLGASSETITVDWSLEVHTLRQELVGDVRTPLLAFLVAAGLLLAVACANVANLLLARGVRRERELAVRAALGAGRGRLVGGLLVESLVLTGVAGLVGIGLSVLGTRLFTALAPPELPRLDLVDVDGAVILFTVALTLVVVATAGFLPALRVQAFDLAPALRASRDREGGRRGTRTRRTLVVGELALSLVLLFGTALLVRTFRSFTAWDPGFEHEDLWATSLFASSGVYPTRAEVGVLWERVEEALTALPGVEAAAAASSIPLMGGRETSKYRADGMETIPEEELPAVRWYDVAPQYFETLGVPLQAGRPLTGSDRAGAPPVALVNETFAERTWPGDSPLGRRVVVQLSEATTEPLEVVGVVADVPPLTPGTLPEPEIYWSNRQFGRWGTLLIVRTRSGQPATAARIGQAIESAGTEITVGTLRDMGSLVDARLVRPRFNLLVMGSFGAVTVLLGLVGLYGVLAYEVAQGARAIGVRLAMGSTPGRVVRDVMIEAGALAVVGVVVGAFVAVVVSGLVASLVYGVSATDPLTLASSAGILVVLAVAASALPALRASRLDPGRLLRDV